MSQHGPHSAHGDGRDSDTHYGEIPLYEEAKPVKVETEEKPVVEMKPERKVEEKSQVITPTKKDVEPPREEVKPEKEIKPVEKQMIEQPIEEKKSVKEKKQECLF